MMDLIKTILSDLRVELTEKFDQNFSQGAFFGKKWKPKRNGEDSHLIKSGRLRRSIRSKIEGNTLVFSSDTPYSAIHNEGGEITVTAKMKGFFWAKFKETGQEQYKAMALMKVGSKIQILQRQFIGEFSGIEKTIERTAKRAIEEELNQLTKRK